MKYIYEIWIVRDHEYMRSRDLKPSPELYKKEYSLKDCGFWLNLSPNQVRERISWGFDESFKSYFVNLQFAYQIKRIRLSRQN